MGLCSIVQTAVHSLSTRECSFAWTMVKSSKSAAKQLNNVQSCLAGSVGHQLLQAIQGLPDTAAGLCVGHCKWVWFQEVYGQGDMPMLGTTAWIVADMKDSLTCALASLVRAALAALQWLRASYS